MTIQSNMSQPLGILFFFIFVYTANALHCVSESGASVDWVFVYKLPPSQISTNTLIKKGVGYVTMSSHEPNWTLSKFGIDDDASVLATHMKMYLEGKGKISYLAYNEQLPNGKENKTAGYTKGLIVADSVGGFWATGSIPGFPGSEEKFTYPANGRTKAELFSCISMELEMIDKIGTSLIYRQAQIYGAHITPDMEESLPTLVSVIKGENVASAPWYHLQNLQSRSNMFFISYSKSREYNGELYKDLIASDIGGDFMVRSSTLKIDGLSSNCTSPKVENIQVLFIKEAEMTITNPEDNAKWALSTQGQVMCIGDMDRNESEKHRGGGATCTFHSLIIRKFQEIIKLVEKCP